MTVLEAIQKTAQFLEGKGVETARLNAELLLAHVMVLPRMRLYLAFDQPLSAEQIDALRTLAVRRGRREPLQQIVGVTSFCGFEIAVTPAVLVPRPETELLVEAALECAAAITIGSDPLRFLDIGTGSGCIAIALALREPRAQVTALDVSPHALETARSNVSRHNLESRITLIESDLLNALDQTSKFHVVAANPPYIPTAEIQGLAPEVRDFEPRNALDGGPDGLDFYRRIAAELPVLMVHGGRIIAEFGDGQGDAVAEIFRRQNWIVESLREDYTRRQRILVAAWTHSSAS